MCCTTRLAFSVVVGHGAHGRFEIGRGLLLNLICVMMDFEAVQSGHKLVGGSLGPVLRMNHE